VFAIGSLTGLALWASGAYQGRLCASAIHTVKVKPELFGMALAPAAIVEGFAVFAFIFGLVLAGGLGT
jgi:V/A-type H+-transporting ATPase subunit K